MSGILVTAIATGLGLTSVELRAQVDPASDALIYVVKNKQKFGLTGDTSTMTIDTQPINCSTLEPAGEAPIPVASPGSTNLTATGSRFHLNWQTDEGWAGSCRRLTVRIPAESDAVANFSFS